MAVARVCVLGADQLKSRLWERDWKRSLPLTCSMVTSSFSKGSPGVLFVCQIAVKFNFCGECQKDGPSYGEEPFKDQTQSLSLNIQIL